MKKETLYEKVFVKLYNAIDYMLVAYKNQDINRNHTNYGAATAYASVLAEMGYEVDLRVYGDGDYLITDRVKIGDKEYDFFH